jgi:proline utilization trans-activator
LHARLDDKEANRRRYAWWTLYILDRKFSSLMGAPNSIQDSDLTVQLPASDTAAQKHKAFGIHVALSKLHAKILNSK